MTAAPLLGLPGERRHPLGPNLVRVGLLLVLAFVVLAGGAGYWLVWQAPSLSTSPQNPAVIAAHRHVVRGLIYDRNGRPLAQNRTDALGEPYRVYADRSVSPLLGYASRYYGTSGVEQALDARLSGVASGDPVYDSLRKFESNPYDPADLTLSISLPLQQAAVRQLGNYVGSVVMLDPKTGQVLAMASTPTFDASGVASPDRKKAAAAWQAANGDANHPFLDRATQGLYVPGSVFKIVTALAALGSGAITPSTTYPDQPKEETTGYIVNGFKVVDGHHPWTGNQALDFYGAVEESCNIYFAHTGLKTGGATLKSYADLLGFDAQLPFELPTAKSTLNAGTGSFGGGFLDATELANAAYGQAQVSVTPLQMALVAAAVANGGELMKPSLVLSSKTKAGVQLTQPQVMRSVVPPDVAAEVTKAMQQAVEGRYGKLFTTGAAVSGVPTAGKSGTAQLGGSGEPNSWFIGFAPANDPQVAIAVVVEHGGSGAIKASPIAGSLMTYYLKNVLPGQRSGHASGADGRVTIGAPIADSRVFAPRLPGPRRG